MRNSVPAMVVSIILLFFNMIIAPSYFIGMINWRNDMNVAQTAARDFIDRAIDGSGVSDDMIADLNLSLASCTCTFEYDVKHETRLINPANGTPGSTDQYTTGIVMTEPDSSKSIVTQWVPTNSDVYSQGDIITIEIRQTSSNIFQQLAKNFLSSSYNNKTIRFSGMVR